MADVIESRVFGALKCLDRATGAHLKRGLRLASDGLSFVRNRSSLYVIREVANQANYSRTFDSAPDEPPVESLVFNIEISDPLREYLPRTVEVSLPRDADPDNSDDIGSVFRSIDVDLYPAANATVMANWSTVRVAIKRGSDEAPVAGALLRIVRRSDDVVLASGISDQRGEALVIVPGIPITQFAEGSDAADDFDPDVVTPVVISEIPVRLELSLTADAVWPANPDLLELNHSTNIVATENLSLRTGRMEKVTIQLA